MSELIPTTPRSLLDPLTDPAGGSAFSRLRSFTAQGPVRRALPWFGGLAALGGLVLTWATLAPAPQRTLYSELSDGEQAQVAAALDKAAIAYRIDNDTGALSVDEDDLYRARMLVAADGGLATPEASGDALASLPMGASRTLEGEKLRASREHELTLTIMEIDGVEAVRVHLAEAEKSVFVRDNAPPTASVMLRLARGRQLSDSQVAAIINLVAASQPGLTVDAVRVIDQHGHLLSDRAGGDGARLELQGGMEDKLRTQIEALLTPMLGAGNFSSEIQVDLDMDQATSARESYDKNGVVRSETQAQSQSSASGNASGVPGVLSNTPAPAASASPGPPQGTPSAAPAPQGNGESSTSRTYELGREVAVTNSSPGRIKRLSVAVALSAAAMKNGKPADVEQIKQLVSAAVGADPARGDQVAVVIRQFDATVTDPPAFYEAPWFAMVLRNVVALIAVLLVLMLGVRPLARALKRQPADEAAGRLEREGAGEGDALARTTADPVSGAIDAALLSRQVGLAQRMVAEEPESAVATLRQMLRENPAEQAA